MALPLGLPLLGAPTLQQVASLQISHIPAAASVRSGAVSRSLIDLRGRRSIGDRRAAAAGRSLAPEAAAGVAEPPAWWSRIVNGAAQSGRGSAFTLNLAARRPSSPRPPLGIGIN